MTNLPQVASRDEWLTAHTELLNKKKETTRAPVSHSSTTRGLVNCWPKRPVSCAAGAMLWVRGHRSRRRSQPGPVRAARPLDR